MILAGLASCAFSNKDTTVIVMKHYTLKKFMRSDPLEYRCMNDTLYRVGKKAILSLDPADFRENNRAVNAAVFKCCRILDRKGLVALTGVWTVESIYNDYREYSRSGRLKLKGSYSTEQAWLKVGTWQYYDPKGRLYKTIVYDASGKVLRKA